MDLIEEPYLPKVIAWAISPLSDKLGSYPQLNCKIKFHGDTGDWVSKSGWQSLCLIAAEICRNAGRYANSEFSAEEEQKAFRILHTLEKSILTAYDLETRQLADIQSVNQDITNAAQAIIDLELSYPDDSVAEWKYLFSEWSYGDFSSPGYPPF